MQQAMAVSLQQHEEEYKQQLETIQTLQQEHADLQLQLQTAQAAIRQSQDALDKAHSCLQQLLVQVRCLLRATCCTSSGIKDKMDKHHVESTSPAYVSLLYQ